MVWGLDVHFIAWHWAHRRRLRRVVHFCTLIPSRGSSQDTRHQSSRRSRVLSLLSWSNTPGEHFAPRGLFFLSTDTIRAISHVDVSSFDIYLYLGSAFTVHIHRLGVRAFWISQPLARRNTNWLPLQLLLLVSWIGKWCLCDIVSCLWFTCLCCNGLCAP